jgi:hypothetical protein
MKHRIGWLVLGALLLLSSQACYGPNHLSRGLDEWGNQLYVDSPWLAQLSHFLGLFTVGHWVATAIDYVFLNPFDFWGPSVPRHRGTPHLYKQPLRPENHHK